MHKLIINSPSVRLLQYNESSKSTIGLHFNNNRPPLHSFSTGYLHTSSFRTCTWYVEQKNGVSNQQQQTAKYSSRKPNTVASTPQSRNPSNTEKTSKNGEEK